MILKQLLNGRQHSDFILIKDNLSISGLKVLKLFIEDNLTQGNNVLFFMYEHPSYEFNKEFLPYKNFTPYNCFDDPWNWLGDSEPNKFEKILESGLSNDENSVNVIVIDSLVYLLLQLDMYTFCHSYKELFESNSKANRNQIIAVLHTYSLQEDNVELRQFNCMAKSVITLERSAKENLNLIIAEHRKPSGKILKEEYSCWLDSKGNLSYETFNNQLKEEPVAETNPMELTTFKLSLEDREKESRSRVILPYVKLQRYYTRLVFQRAWVSESPAKLALYNTY
ncbi:elongator complex protein 5 isoform X2 [Rhodnius prolixus]|uniref:elongator complex protein 5 isoform X2 n=1 Tax=Rhodnius prolixus TaxID=13249 RepID=UPI003D18F9D5